MLSPEPNPLAPRHRLPLIFLPPSAEYPPVQLQSFDQFVNSRADLTQGCIRLATRVRSPNIPDSDPEARSNVDDLSSRLTSSSSTHPGIPHDDNLFRSSAPRTSLQALQCQRRATAGELREHS